MKFTIMIAAAVLAPTLALTVHATQMTHRHDLLRHRLWSRTKLLVAGDT